MTTATLTRKKSVTIPEQVLEQAQLRVGARGLSEYVTRALQTQLEIDALQEYVAAAESVNGPTTSERRNQVLSDLATADTAFHD